MQVREFGTKSFGGLAQSQTIHLRLFAQDIWGFGPLDISNATYFVYCLNFFYIPARSCNAFYCLAYLHFITWHCTVIDHGRQLRRIVNFRRSQSTNQGSDPVKYRIAVVSAKLRICSSTYNPVRRKIPAQISDCMQNVNICLLRRWLPLKSVATGFKIGAKKTLTFV